MTDRIKATYMILETISRDNCVVIQISGCHDLTFDKTWKTRHGAQGAVKRIAEKLNLELTEVKP